MYKIILQSMATRIEPWTKKKVFEAANFDEAKAQFSALADKYNIAENIQEYTEPRNGVLMETTEAADYSLTLEYDEHKRYTIQAAGDSFIVSFYSDDYKKLMVSRFLTLDEANALATELIKQGYINE